jgi:hypothetical protein
MFDRSFSLQPFPIFKSLPSIAITGNLDRRENLLAIDYSLVGNLENLSIPKPTQTPTRKHELWQETCLEFFLGVKNSPHYWEFNLSTTGDWNIYRFQDYRQGMEEEKKFSSLPFDVEKQADRLLLKLEFDLNKIVPEDKSLEISITAVVKQIDGEITYWALTHCGEKADFHRRDSFAIEI